MRARSLHARLLIGAVVWTAGVLGASAVAMVAITLHPGWAWSIHYSIPILAGLVFIGAGLAVVRRGLSPFRRLRERLAAVRDGRTSRVDGEYPVEVAPLVDDLNALLEERDHRVVRAVAKAGDLAHGLKTPLAILAQEIDRAEAVGQHALATTLRQQVDRMRRQIDSHLAQARATASGTPPGARADVADAAHGLARTMGRLYAERALVITVDIPPGCLVRVPLEDLEEMLGNLLDNACKWARSRVSVSTALATDRIVIDVNDDGPGLDPAMCERVLQRGVRADETSSGSGLGLAIVGDLADAYGGALTLERSHEGGIRARLTLPAQS